MNTDERNDYLWDASAPPDPEVQRLEGLLGRYRLPEDRRAFAPDAAAQAPREAPQAVRARRRFGIHPRAILATALAAGLAAAALIFWAVGGLRSGSYRVIGLDGHDFVRAGERFSTGSDRGARLEIGWLGHVDLEPNTRIGVEDCGRDAHRLFLERGTVKAKIWAQPRLFQIGTPAGNSIDLGCEYELGVAEGGASFLRVITGQVAFEFEGREVYVPAGWTCRSDPARGPGAPVHEDASEAYRRALEAVEFSAEPDSQQVARVLDVGHEGTLTLWHLLTSDRTASSLRHAAYEKLSLAYSKPKSVEVTEAGILAGDARMRAAWLEEMKPSWR